MFDGIMVSSSNRGRSCNTKTRVLITRLGLYTPRHCSHKNKHTYCGTNLHQSNDYKTLTADVLVGFVDHFLKRVHPVVPAVMIHFPRAAEFHFDFLGWQGRHYRLRDLQMKTEWKCSEIGKKKPNIFRLLKLTLTSRAYYCTSPWCSFQFSELHCVLIISLLQVASCKEKLFFLFLFVLLFCSIGGFRWNRWLL